MSTMWKDDWEECSVIGDKGDIGFIDYEDDKSVYSYNPEEEEGPVVISVPFPFVKGKPQSILVGDTISDTITIKNNTNEPVDLWSVKIYNSNPEDSYTLSLMEPPSADSDVEAIQGFLEASSLEDRMVQPGKTLKIWLVCKPKDIGLHTTVVHFDVGHDGQRTERVVFLLAEDKISRSLASNKPYSRVPRKKHCVVTDYVVGSRPARQTTQGFKHRLPQFAIPIETRELLEAKQIPEVLTDGLTRDNYSAFFSTLIIMEELHLEEDMRGHDMECVNMWRRGPNFLALEVPGLAERRPSLVYGDFIFAKLVTSDPDDETPPYQGYIHRVEADEIFLKFAKDLHLQHRDGDLYNVRFTYNRVNMRRLYHAVQAAENLESELLFPSQFPKKRSIKATPVVPLSPFVNEEQMFSVEMILGCKGSPPYVIHGPPGTGKTMTLVEAILQLYTTRQNTRILVCAASNSAADHILERLISKEAVEIQDKEVFRLNATSRPYEDVRPDNIRFCYFEESVFKCPPLKALMRYKIIISTYMSASLLYAEGIKTGHFSHIFLDEAGQASEPETMTAISNLCRRETVVVLAGDPMQLGPVIFSKEAETWGLGKSYLVRLFECEYYSSEDENYVTKLVRNYRCHPKILELPSELFYNGELIACKEEKCSSTAAWKSLLPNKEFPVLFIGIQGCDEREGNNPSWFNRFEASKVVEIIKKITASSTLSETDIGVITPYRQQVMKLKKALETLDMPEVKVGSVEQFQGQEREVIIISTVRSTVKHNEFDKLHYLGFLSNPRRFNVAITRAKSLLVIIGNPHIISKDPYWEKLLWYCSDNNSYQGCPLPEKPDVTEEFQGQENNWEGEQENPQATEWTDGWTEEFPKTVQNEGKWPGEWNEELPKPVVHNEGKWPGEWTEELPNPVHNEGKWPGEWNEELPKPVHNEGKWPGEWTEELPKPVHNEGKWPGEWNEELSKPVTNTGKWADECDEKIPGPVTNEDEWSDGWNEELSKPVTNTGKWADECDEKIPGPVTNEDEWSDGWK